MIAKLIIGTLIVGITVFAVLGYEIFHNLKRLRISDDDIKNSFKDVIK